MIKVEEGEIYQIVTIQETYDKEKARKEQIPAMSIDIKAVKIEGLKPQQMMVDLDQDGDNWELVVDKGRNLGFQSPQRLQSLPS